MFISRCLLSLNEQIILKSACISLNISSIDNLHSVSSYQLSKQKGVNVLLRKYGGKLPMLENIFPEHNWNIFKMDRFPKGFWLNKSNHRLFLDYYGNKMKFKSPKEWSTISIQKLKDLGGSTLLQYYTNWYNALECIYPEENWNFNEKTSISNKFNNNHENYQWIKESLKLSSPNDILSLSNTELQSNNILKQLYDKYNDKYIISKLLFPEYNKNNNNNNTLSFSIDNISLTFWKSKDNQRKYIIWLLTQKHLYSSQKEWGKLKKQDIRNNKGRVLIYKYKSIYNIYLNLFPDIKWDPLIHSSLPQGYWDNIENQKNFIIVFEKHHSINHYHDWTYNKIIELRKYDTKWIKKQYKDVLSMLNILFPQRNIIINDNSDTYLQNKINYLSDKWNLKSLQDWHIITQKMVLKEGIKLDKYNNSIYQMLKTLYPLYKWNLLNSPLPQGFWNNKDNQREFLDSLCNKLQYNEYNDKYNLTKHIIKVNGGSKLLCLYPNIYNIMIILYPEYNWNKYLFKQLPHRYWNNIDNQKEFIDYLINKLEYNSINDMIYISRKTIIENGGRTLLNKYKNIYQMLQTLYPSLNWNIFQRDRVFYNYWKDKNNIISFMNNIKYKYDIQSTNDWERISWRQIKFEGGSGLETHFKSCLYSLLSYCYPNECFNKENIKKTDKKSSQRWLYIQIQKIYKNIEIIEEYKDISLKRKSGISLELDIYIPSLSLAFEYHGEQHYNEIPVFGSLELYNKRDKEKIEICKNNGIDLIIIPYYWNNSLEELKDYIKQYDKIHSTNFLFNTTNNNNILIKE